MDLNSLVGGVNDLAQSIAMMVGAAKKDLNTKNGADSKEEDGNLIDWIVYYVIDLFFIDLFLYVFIDVEFDSLCIY